MSMTTNQRLATAFAFEPGEQARYRMAPTITVTVKEAIWTIEGILYLCEFPNGQASARVKESDLLNTSDTDL